jgi:hypothetical protein
MNAFILSFAAILKEKNELLKAVENFGIISVLMSTIIIMKLKDIKR